LRCRATDAGDHFVVSGQKIWTSLGHIADHCILLVRTGAPDSAHRGLTMLWVDFDWPGITRRPIRCANDRNDLAEVFYDDVVVPKDRLVGDVGQGWAVAMYLLQFERGMYAWQRQSWLHHRLSELAASPSLPAGAAARIGEAYEVLFSLRIRCGDTVRRLAAGESPGPEISIDKVLLATAEQTVLDAARDLLAPDIEIGDDMASATWRWQWWYTRAASIYGGAAEIQRSILAERVLGLPR
jgi:alkylation response protein AidB-like acyl-CoA dehydrogenase